MKTLVTIILTITFPIFSIAQVQNLNFIKLKTLDERTVDPEEIFQGEDLTIFYFFNEESRNIIDQFDYLENLAEEYSGIQLKIFAVYNAINNIDYGQIKTFVRGNEIGIETLIDVNGELQRAMGLPVNTTVILTRFTNMITGSYVQSVSYTPEQADAELSMFLSNEDHDPFNNHYLSSNVSSK